MVTFTGSLTWDTTGAVDKTKLTTIVQTKNNRPELSLPLAQIGQIVPWVIGRYRITTPNFIWYGNVKNIVKVTKKERTETKEKDVQVRSPFWVPGQPYPDDAIPLDSDLADIARQSVEDPMFLSSIKVYETETIVTYEREVTGYTVDAAVGICLGPNVELLAIYSDKKRIWSGNLTGRAEVAGNGKEGSLIENGFIYHSGNFDQAPEPYLAGIPGGPASDGNLTAYVGIAYIVFKTVNSAALSGADIQFEVRRLPNPLGLPDDVNVIGGNDINPSTAVADILLNDWGGVGIDPEWIDVDNLKLAAQRYKSERLGMSLAIAQENYGVTLINAMQDQTRSIVYADPETSLIRIKPLRPDAYDEDALLEVTPSIGSSIQRLEKTAFLAMPTHFSIRYYNRARNYEATTVINRNPAVPPTENRAKRLASIDFGAVCTEAIAEASFDLILSSISAPQLGASIVTNRVAADLVPGDLFLISWPLYEMEKFPVYVTKVREQELESNSVLIECDQYMRPNVRKFFKPPTPSNHVAPDLTAHKATDGMILDAPWWILQRKGHNGNPNQDLDSVFPMFLLAGANDSQLYFDIYNRDNDAALLEVEPYPLTAKLVGGIAKTDAHKTWVLDSVTIRQVVNADYLANVGFDGVVDGIRLMFIGEEIFCFEGFVNNNDGTYTLLNVHRGMVDTVAMDHHDNDTVYITDIDGIVLSDKGHTPPRAPYHYSTISRAMRNVGEYPADAYHLDDYWPYDRAGCPLRPHNVLINLERKVNPIELVIGDKTEVYWYVRSRMLKQLATMEKPAEYPEIMSNKRRQAHVVYIIDANNDEHVIGNSLTGDDAGNYPTEYVDFASDMITFDIPGGIAEGPAILKVESSIMKYDPPNPPLWLYGSWQTEEIAIYILPAGSIKIDFEFNYEVE